jgi:formylglycine-generating enzyme required for sulfatase activity
MIGNVWEMTQEWFFTLGLENPITDQGHSIPGLAMFGLALQETPLPAGYNDDAVWGIASGGYITGVNSKHPQTPNMALRGGSFQAGLRAGIFSLAVDASVGARLHYVGFRCVIPRHSR